MKCKDVGYRQKSARVGGNDPVGMETAGSDGKLKRIYVISGDLGSRDKTLFKVAEKSGRLKECQASGLRIQISDFRQLGTRQKLRTARGSPEFHEIRPVPVSCPSTDNLSI